jgi:hypothetical protein
MCSLNIPLSGHMTCSVGQNAPHRRTLYDRMLPWMTEVSGIPLNNRQNLSCSLYSKTGGEKSSELLGGPTAERSLLWSSPLVSRHRHAPVPRR